MNSLPHIASRVFNTPVAIHPGKAEIIARIVTGKMGLEGNISGAGDGINVFAMAGGSTLEFTEQTDPTYAVTDDGIAIIRVCGTLVQKSSWLDSYSGMMGYSEIRSNVAMALADKTVKAILFDIDSPGGEVSGCFDLVDAIYGARGSKPMWSSLSESAYSAAYAIASATDRILVPRTGGTGSVGVICMIAEFSKALTNAGIAVSIFKYGARKADGNQYSPIDDAAAKRFQAEVDTMGDLFVETVARNRNMSASKVRATEATTYMGAAGVDIGFADAVMAPDEAYRSLLSFISK